LNTKYKKTMLMAALVFITANFHHPVTPKFFTMLNLPNHLFGTSFAVMVFSVFLTSPIWGSLGDNNSRKKTLVYATLFYGMSQIAFGLSQTVWQVLLTRAIAGIFSGGFMVGLMAMVVDVSDADKRGERIAAYSALMSITMSIGFLIGGALGYLPIRYVFFIQGSTMIVVSFLMRFILEESNEAKADKTSKPEFIWNILQNKERSKEIFTPWIVVFLGITFFVFIAFSSNNSAFNYYLREELNFEPIVNGIWKATTGIIGLVANLTINVWIVRKKELKTALRAILSLSLLGATMIFINNSVYPFMIWALFYFTMHTILFPLLQNFAVQRSAQGVGFMAGLFNAVKALGEMVGSSVAGFSYDFGSKIPFLISSIALSIAVILSIVQYINRNKEIDIEKIANKV
jgi:DHA1 family multidrug resistance protein-like MFS transporter